MSHAGDGHPISKRGAWILCLFVSGTGLLIVLVAAGVIPADERSFEAPRWVVGALGVTFALTGLAMVTMPIGRPSAPAEQASPWSLQDRRVDGASRLRRGRDPHRSLLRLGGGARNQAAVAGAPRARGQLRRGS
jgi:hypothetical protein